MTANVVSFPDAYREYGFINGKRCRVPRCKEDYLHFWKQKIMNRFFVESWTMNIILE